MSAAPAAFNIREPAVNCLAVAIAWLAVTTLASMPCVHNASTDKISKNFFIVIEFKKIKKNQYPVILTISVEMYAAGKENDVNPPLNTRFEPMKTDCTPQSFSFHGCKCSLFCRNNKLFGRKYHKNDPIHWLINQKIKSFSARGGQQFAGERLQAPKKVD